MLYGLVGYVMIICHSTSRNTGFRVRQGQRVFFVTFDILVVGKIKFTIIRYDVMYSDRKVSTFRGNLPLHLIL
jgi:hypothetical protein